MLEEDPENIIVNDINNRNDRFSRVDYKRVGFAVTTKGLGAPRRFNDDALTWINWVVDVPYGVFVFNYLLGIMSSLFFVHFD